MASSFCLVRIYRLSLFLLRSSRVFLGNERPRPAGRRSLVSDEPAYHNSLARLWIAPVSLGGECSRLPAVWFQYGFSVKLQPVPACVAVRHGEPLFECSVNHCLPRVFLLAKWLAGFEAGCQQRSKQAAWRIARPWWKTKSELSASRC